MGEDLSLYLQRDKDNPSMDEILTYARHTIEHSHRVHSYLAEIGIGINDNEVPHDLVGPGNKLEWQVMRGLALHAKDTEEKERRFQEALQRHRMQRHHRMWNVQNPEATEIDLKYGAIDSITCLFEERPYYGGKSHTLEEIKELIQKNPEYKQPWLNWALQEILKVNEK